MFNFLKNFKILLLLLFLVYIGVIIRGCFSEKARHSLDLSIDTQNDNLCLYTNNNNHFLGEPDDETYFLVWIASFDSDINIFDKKIMLKDRVFPFKKEDCISIPIDLFEVNKPYEFVIENGKPFKKRACILRKKKSYKIKEVHSMENCEY